MRQKRTSPSWLVSEVGPPRGILNAPPPSAEEFRLSLRRPAQTIAPIIDYYWILSWDLRHRGPHIQNTVPQPNVHVAFEPGSSHVYGVVTGKYSRCLEGTSRVFAIKFAPGMFRPFLGEPVSLLGNRTRPVQEVFGKEGVALQATLTSQAPENDLVAAADDFFLAHIPEYDEKAHISKRLVRQILEDRGLRNTDDLALRSGTNKRGLQRLFAEYVGASPKWVIRLYRLHEAVNRLRSGERLDGAQLAYDLGYFDQSHLINDFKHIVGYTPTQLHDQQQEHATKGRLTGRMPEIT